MSEQSSGATGTDTSGGTKHTAGLFDVRFFIGALIGIYGIVLTVYGLFITPDSQMEKADGLNLNLVAGIIMVVTAAGFLAWQRLRPTIVDEAALPPEDDRPKAH